MTANSASTPASSKAPIPAETAESVSELKAALAASQKKEKALQQRINTLEAEQQKQSAYVTDLRSYLDKANELKAELDRTQKEASKLEKANAKLAKEMESLLQERQQPPAPAPTPVPAPSKPPASRPIAQDLLQERDADRNRYGRRPVGPSQNPPQGGEDFTKQTWLL
jgi:DNA repair exonuclease SbcCD ATPase subunit